MEFKLTPEQLSAIVGVCLSLLFSYIPGLSTKFAALGSQMKSLIMAGLLLVVAGAVFGLSCGTILQVNISCDKAGVIQLVTIYVSALIANQGAYLLSPQTNAVKKALADKGT